MPGLDALGCADCEGAGSLFEPDSSSAFEAKSSNSPSSLPPNDTRSLAAAEGCWSRRVKRTGEMSMCHWLYEENHITKVVKFRPSERCFSVGGAVINGVQGPKKAGLTKTARHLQQSRKICYFMKCSGKRESPDSGRESMDQLLHARTAGCLEAASRPSRESSGSTLMARSTAKASSLEERRSCSRRWRIINVRSLG